MASEDDALFADAMHKVIRWAAYGLAIFIVGCGLVGAIGFAGLISNGGPVQYEVKR